MFYGYSKKGLIASSCDTHGIRSHKDGRCKNVFFDGNAFKHWLDQYIAGGSTSTKVDLDALVNEYAS
jgi:hypothetical protein